MCFLKLQLALEKGSFRSYSGISQSDSPRLLGYLSEKEVLFAIN